MEHTLLNDVSIRKPNYTSILWWLKSNTNHQWSIKSKPIFSNPLRLRFIYHQRLSHHNRKLKWLHQRAYPRRTNLKKYLDPQTKFLLLFLRKNKIQNVQIKKKLLASMMKDRAVKNHLMISLVDQVSPINSIRVTMTSPPSAVKKLQMRRGSLIRTNRLNN